MSNFHKLCDPLKNKIVNKLGWRNLTSVQEMTIPDILDGKNAVILAPTAGGKTEAAFFPILSLIHEEELNPISVLYISPIKALLNNQEERLKKLSSFVYGEAFKWHGDVESGEKSKFYKNPAQILMITPESLEVMLMSKKINKQEMFSNIRFVVIDEVHAFADSERGSHLMAIIERIQTFSKYDIQRIGLSATVGNPEEICNWMQGSSRRENTVVDPPKEKNPKKIEIKFIDSETDFSGEIYKRIYGKKSLFFSNSRTAAENIKLLIEENGIDCHVHHSSIDKYFREKAEEKFKLGKNTSIIATSTLELGIDIGDLDIVLQLDTPHSVSSFLQRIGRTGRRKGSISHFVFFPTKKEKLVMSVTMINLAIKKWVEDVFISKRSYDILFYQIITMTLSEYGVDKDRIFEVLNNVYCFTNISKQDYDELIEFMVKEKYIQLERGKVFVDENTSLKFGRKNFITLYSAFETNKEFVVKFKNREIGTLEKWFVNALGEEFTFILAGKCWITDKIDFDKFIIYVKETSTATPPKWMSDPSFISYELAREYFNILVNKEKYMFLNDYEMKVLEDIRYEEEVFGLEKDKLIIEERGNDIIFYTYAGNRVNYTLANTLSLISKYFDIVGLNWKGFKLRSADKEFKIKLNDVLDKIVEMRDYDYFNEDIVNILKQKVPDISMSKYQKYLPEEFRKSMIFDYVYDIDKTVEFLSENKVKVIEIY